MLNVEDITSLKASKALSNRSLYKDILQRIYDKILWAAARGHSQIQYYIRPLQPGLPLVNTQNACNYVKTKLLKGGFLVEDISGGGTVLLTITWEISRKSLLQKLANKCVSSDEPKF